MVEMISADVLDWARDLSLIRSLVAGESAPASADRGKVIELRARRAETAR